MMSLFSRGSSPPPGATNMQAQPAHHAQQAPPVVQNVPPPVDAYAEPPSHVIHSPLPSRPSPVQSGNTLDELLKGLSATSPHLEPEHPPSPPPFSNLTQQSPPASNPQPSSQQTQPAQDLLAILTNAAQNASPASNSSSQQQPTISQKPPQPQTSTISAPESNNAGRMLLDSLLSSTAPQPQPPRLIDTGYQAPGTEQTGQQAQAQQQQPPLRKTAFDFVSPMDAFQSNPSSSPASSMPKRKTAASEGSEGHPASIGNQPATGPMTSTSPLGAATVTSETVATSNITGDSASGAPGEKTNRKSIDLLEQLTRAAPLPLQHQNIPPPLEQSQPASMFPGSGVAQLAAQAAAYRRPSPVPLLARDQSPALLGQTPPSTSPPVHVFPGSLSTAQASIPARASPTFRGRANTNNATKKGDWKTKNNFSAKSPAGPQSFTLDLSLPLAATSASSDRLHITPIALLKLESIYVPGCTIGVSHWIAYAMTKGRVRLIARANGARALLKLPATFSATSSIVDLVTSGNRLAGVTSDGGFVVWEVPPMVDDDIPSLLLVSVPPTPNNPYKSIKWHPTDPNVLALSTQSELHLINVQNLYHIHAGDSISQNVLVGDAEVFSPVSNPSAGGGLPQQQAIAAFAFDPSHNSVATISVEGVLNVWAIGAQQQTNYLQSYQHQQLLWSGKVPGEGQPSSMFFMDQQQGVIVGRKRNTVIQLVPYRSTNVHATVRFVQGNGVLGSTNTNTNNQGAAPDDREFFAHLAYDPRIRCVWAASSHRPSLMALRIVPPDEGSKVGVESALHFEQILDFPILHPTISLGILVTSDGNEVEEMERGSGMDVNGSAGPGGAGQEMSMALVAYVIHAGGVDQVLIGKQDLELASQNALVKLPPGQNTQPNTTRQDSPSLYPTGSPANVNPGTPNHPSGPRELKKSLPSNPPAYVPPTTNEPPPAFVPPPIAAGGRNFGPMDTASPLRPRSPASDADGAELLENPADTRINEGGKRRRGKKQQQQGAGTDRSTDSGVKPVSGFGAAEAAAIGLAAESSGSIIREIQKVEDGIQSKITSTVAREFRDQTKRLEQLHEEDRFNASEFQDKLVRTLSGELVKSTGRVFEAALKTEVQRTILPALEMITKNEVRQAVDVQIVRGLGESMKQTLPNEIERLLLRPDVSNHVARTFSSAVTPLIERHVKEQINRTLIPSYQKSTHDMYDQLYQEINEEILNLKKEIITWQSDALKGQEALLREMELSIRSLTDQVKAMSGQRSITPYNMQSHRSSPAPIPAHLRQQTAQPYQPMDKMANINSWQQMNSAAVKQDIPLGPTIPPPHQTSLPQTIYQPPQQPPTHTLQPAPQTIPQPQYRHDTPTEDWEKVFLQALSAPDIRALREVLLNCPADKVMPLNGPLLVTQTIVLSVIHKLAGYLVEVESIDESISLLWWLTRSSQVLDAHDRIIHDYLDRMLPNIQENLFRAIPRFTTAGPQYSRQLSELLQTLVIKAHQ